MSGFVTYPFLAQGDVSFQDGTPISYLPQPEQTLDTVYATLITSEQLHPQARCIGSIRPECDSVRVALHMLLSIAMSHRNNLLFPIQGFEHIARAYIVMRTYVPNPHRPDVFAVLVQVVVGARNAVVVDHDPNVSSMLPTLNVREEGSDTNAPEESDSHAAGPSDDDPFSITNALLLSAVRSGATGGGGAGRKKPKPSRQDASTKLLSVVDVPSFLRVRLTAGVRERYEHFANIDRLLPPVRGAAASSPGGQRWDLMSLPEEMGSISYLRSFLALLSAAGYDVIATDVRSLSTESTSRPLTRDQKAAFDDCRSTGRLWFSDAVWSNMTAVRMAISLPVALKTLHLWTAKHVQANRLSEFESWWQLRWYTTADLARVSSPLNCHVLVEPVQDEEPAGISLRTFLYRPLPMKAGIHSVFSMAAVQLSILSHRDEREVLRLFTSATAAGLSGDASPWLPGLVNLYSNLLERFGSLSTGKDVPAEDLLRFFMARFSTTRTIPVEIEDLKEQGARETVELLGSSHESIRDVDRAAVQQMLLADFEMLTASGADPNTVAWSSYCFFRLSCVPLLEPPRPGPSTDIHDELLNMRRVFAGRQFSDLTSPSAMWAKLGIAIREATGLVRVWPECTMLLLFAVASFLDEGERPHLEVSGDPSSGKTAIMLGVERCIPSGFVHSNVYRSDAALRNPDSRATKNVLHLAPEAGDQSTSDTRVRAVALSSMSERTVRSETIRIDPATGHRSIATCVTRSSSSWVMGTNLPATDSAFVSRMMSLVMSPLGLPVQFFGEIGACTSALREVEDVQSEILRALHFFMRCVAAYCMLINAGVVSAPEASVLNVAVLNKLLPRGLDGSHLRFYKQSLKICRAMECMWSVFVFLTEPLSPLTVAFHDRLDLSVLAHVRAVDTSHVSIPVYWASATSRLRRHNALPRVVDVLLATALSPRNSSQPAAVRLLNGELRDARHDAMVCDRDPSTELRRIHLSHLLAMFPRPWGAPGSPGTVPVAFFRWETTARGASGSASAAGAHSIERGHRDVEGENEALAFAGFSAFLPVSDEQPEGKSSDNPSMQQRSLEQLSVLRADDALHATERLVELILSERNGRRTTSLAVAAAGNRTGKQGARRSAGAADVAVASGHSLLTVSSVAAALQTLRITFYTGGWASIDVSMMNCDEISRLHAQFDAMCAEFSVPLGAYITHGCMVPMGQAGAEALPTLVASSCGTRSLCDTLNDNKGRECAMVRTRVSRHLVSDSTVGRGTHVVHESDVTVDGLRKASLRCVLESPLVGAADRQLLGQSARALRLSVDSPGSILCDALGAVWTHGAGTVTARSDSCDAVSENVEEMAVSLSEQGIGRWHKGLIFRGPSSTYHEFEACHRAGMNPNVPSRGSLFNRRHSSHETDSVSLSADESGSTEPDVSDRGKRRRTVPAAIADGGVIEKQDSIFSALEDLYAM